MYCTCINASVCVWACMFLMQGGKTGWSTIHTFFYGDFLEEIEKNIQNDVFISVYSEETLTLCDSSELTFYIYRQKRSSSTMSALFVQKPRTDNLNTGSYKGLLHFSCFKRP